MSLATSPVLLVPLAVLSVLRLPVEQASPFTRRAFFVGRAFIHPPQIPYKKHVCCAEHFRSYHHAKLGLREETSEQHCPVFSVEYDYTGLSFLCNIRDDRSHCGQTTG
jgi:hypothetical protein